MAEWLYKATKKKVPLEPTRKLAIDDGFLCRSAFSRKGHRIALVGGVSFGDAIHFYYSDAGRSCVIGSFEVIHREEHPHAHRFGGLVPGTRLFEVADDEFDRELRSLLGDEGYRPDPVHGKITGWLLRRRDDVRTPAYDGSLFPPKTTLVRGP